MTLEEIESIFICPACKSKFRRNINYLECQLCFERHQYFPVEGIYALTKKTQSSVIKKIDDDWTRHWESSSRLFYAITSFLRKFLVAPLVKSELDKIIDCNQKIYLEAGAGTSETSEGINFKDNDYISLDISFAVLLRSINTQIKIQGDLFDIPISDESIDVIFNVGVHEHYSDDENLKIFAQYFRILKNGGIIVLFWPWYWGPLMVAGRLINVIMSFIKKEKYEIYPNQNWEIKSIKYVDQLLGRAGFKRVSSRKSIKDIFSMVVLNYKKS